MQRQLCYPSRIQPDHRNIRTLRATGAAGVVVAIALGVVAIAIPLAIATAAPAETVPRGTLLHFRHGLQFLVATSARMLRSDRRRWCSLPTLSRLMSRSSTLQRPRQRQRQKLHWQLVRTSLQRRPEFACKPHRSPARRGQLPEKPDGRVVRKKCR